MTAVAAVDVLTVELPFRFSFGHALAERSSSTNVVVRVRLEDGTVGYGEGVPREYVTGETVESVVGALTTRLVPHVVGSRLDDRDAVAELLAGLPTSAPDGSPQTAARWGSSSPFSTPPAATSDVRSSTGWAPGLPRLSSTTRCCRSLRPRSSSHWRC